MKNYSPDNLQLKQTRAKVMKRIIIAMLVCGFAWQQAQAQSVNEGGAGCELLQILLGITIPGCSTLKTPHHLVTVLSHRQFRLTPARDIPGVRPDRRLPASSPPVMMA